MPPRRRSPQVVEDYVDNMPYRFSGTLEKFVVVLEPQTLTEEDRQRLQREEARVGAAIQ